MSVTIFNRLGQTVRRSQNLRGLLAHARLHPTDIVVKVQESQSREPYRATFYFVGTGDSGETNWGDWRVLLGWIRARRTWSVDRVTFDAPLYDKIEAKEPERLTDFRKSGILLTRHAYAT